jgi:hypothetical protein
MMRFGAWVLGMQPSVVLAGAGCPDVLLRVPRAVRSSLTCPIRPGNPLQVLRPFCLKAKVGASQRQGGGVCCSEIKDEFKGGSLWTGYMSVDRYPHPAAGSARK